jgi:protein TonB
MSILMASTRVAMNAPETPMTLPVPGADPPRPPGSSAWLSAQSIFERPDERKLGRAVTTSFLLHAAIFATLFVSWRVARAVTEPDQKIDVVYLEQPGPGGGGGGSPAPAPPKPKLEVPKTAPTPVVPTPVPVAPPLPELNAPIQTSTDLLQATGANAVSLANYAGGGRGKGIGSGTGDGVGPGSGGGTGGGVYGPGNGVSEPTMIRQTRPTYTSEAMRAKVQGDVELEAVVQPNGLLSDIQITKSLDPQFGLDQEAIKCVKQWLFRPATKSGQAVAFRVSLVIQFRLH